MAKLLILLAALAQNAATDTPPISDPADSAADAASIVADLQAAISANDRYQVATILNRAIVAKQTEAIADSARETLKSDKPHERALSGLVLGHLRKLDEDTIPLLASVFTEPEESSPHLAASAIAKIGKPALDPMVKNLEHKDPRVRRWSAYAIGEMASFKTAAIPALIRGISDEVPMVRAEVIAALGSMQSDGKAAIPALTAALVDSDANVRGTAASALWYIDRQVDVVVPVMLESLADTAQHELDREAGMSVLAKIGQSCDHKLASERIVPAFTRALQDESSVVRASAAEKLAWLGSRSSPAIEALELLQKDKDQKVRNAAAESVKAIRKDVEFSKTIVGEWRSAKISNSPDLQLEMLSIEIAFHSDGTYRQRSEQRLKDGKAESLDHSGIYLIQMRKLLLSADEGYFPYFAQLDDGKLLLGFPAFEEFSGRLLVIELERVEGKASNREATFGRKGVGCHW